MKLAPIAQGYWPGFPPVWVQWIGIIHAARLRTYGHGVQRR